MEGFVKDPQPTRLHLWHAICIYFNFQFLGMIYMLHLSENMMLGFAWPLKFAYV